MRDASSRAPRRHSLRLVAALVVALPVAVGIAYSLAASLGVAGSGAAGLTFTRLGRVVGAASTWHGLLWTMWTATAATTLATVGAVAAAMAFRGNRVTDRVGRALTLLPLPVPHLVAAVLGVWILGQSGMIARAAFALGFIHAPGQMPPLVYDRWGAGLILTMAWKEMAFLALVASALLATRAGAAEEAARTLGASGWTTFHRVTWPILWRGLMPAVVAVFVFVTGSYEAAVLLAPSNPLALPLLVAERATDPDLARRGDAYVVSLLLFAIGAIAVVAHEHARARWGPLDA